MDDNHGVFIKYINHGPPNLLVRLFKALEFHLTELFGNSDIPLSPSLTNGLKELCYHCEIM